MYSGSVYIYLEKNSEGGEKKMKELPSLLREDKVQCAFEKYLKERTPAFIQNLMSIYNSNTELQRCDAVSIVASAALAASLHLEISPTFGQAYIVPYSGRAMFQIGWRGLVQLAHRTGQYQKIHAGVVREGQIQGVNCITGEVILGEKQSEEISGYAAYFKLINGFEKTLYMTKSEVELHAKTYSQSYRTDFKKQKSIWAKQFDRMACKTVLKLLLNRWGILSSELSTAISGDQAVITSAGFEYADNGGTILPREEVGFYEDDNKWGAGSFESSANKHADDGTLSSGEVD